VSDDIGDLLDLALEAYGDDAECAARLERQSARHREPLRVALVGPQGSGKSTLLNAVLEEDVSPTGPEGTRLVTWFRYGETPTVVARWGDGGARALTVRRGRAGAVIEGIDDLEEGVSHLEVEWPGEILRDLTLIDTPGAGTEEILLPEGGPSEADVLVYVTADLSASDLEVLRAHREASAGFSRGIGAVLVLGHADEAAAGRIDALLAARSVAARRAGDTEVGGLASTILPFAGLLAHGARTLRPADLDAVKTIAGLERAQRERITASADAFLEGEPELGLTKAERVALLERLGLFGVRLASVLLNRGLASAAGLSRELIRQSGVDDIDETLARLRSRSDFLKTDAALSVVEGIVGNSPRVAETAELTAAIERVRVSSHDLRELHVLASIRQSALPAELRADVTRLLGGRGTSPAHRLDVDEPIAVEHLVERARDEVSRWRALAEDGRSDPEVVRIARVVVRSAEGMLDQLAG